MRLTYCIFVKLPPPPHCYKTIYRVTIANMILCYSKALREYDLRVMSVRRCSMASSTRTYVSVIEKKQKKTILRTRHSNSVDFPQTITLTEMHIYRRHALISPYLLHPVIIHLKNHRYQYALITSRALSCFHNCHNK